MDVDSKVTIWQHAAGDSGRDYASLCLERNVILHGPGKHGSWGRDCEKILRSKYPKRRIDSLKRFYEEMCEGELVILKRWQNAYGIGIIGSYEWIEEFNHVGPNGKEWDLGHARHVCWIWRVSDVEQPENVPELAPRGTTSHVNDEDARCWVWKHVPDELRDYEVRRNKVRSEKR